LNLATGLRYKGGPPAAHATLATRRDNFYSDEAEMSRKTTVNCMRKKQTRKRPKRNAREGPCRSCTVRPRSLYNRQNTWILKRNSKLI